MTFTVGMSCGHAQRIIGIFDTPPEHDPWTMYPLEDGDTITMGDLMTCIVCLTEQTVTGIYDNTPAIDAGGNLRLP